MYTDTGDIEDDKVETPTFERYEDDTDDGEVKHAPDADEEDITPEECLDEFVEGSETGKGRSTEPGTRIPYLTLVCTTRSSSQAARKPSPRDKKVLRRRKRGATQWKPAFSCFVVDSLKSLKKAWDSLVLLPTAA